MLNRGTLDERTVVRVHTSVLKLFIASIPLIVCTVFFWLRNWDFDIYRRLFVEDGLFANLTSANYFGAAVIATAIALAFKRKGRFISGEGESPRGFSEQF